MAECTAEPPPDSLYSDTVLTNTHTLRTKGSEIPLETWIHVELLCGESYTQNKMDLQRFCGLLHFLAFYSGLTFNHL